ncbi:MAG: hybrid sensor histidine kinase/response regulator [Anaerolineaceae bacterium]|nr:hybrid sensor histidine kinase/response regulator [Anaerolineaceae bacterium]
MGRSAKIREQLISTFRAELVEHVQVMTDGLLSLEQGRVPDQERASTLETIFRAAHSLKGAARAVNVTVVEQLAHSLEGVLDGMQREVIQPSAGLFTACYRALDAIQAVQAAYEAGETTPPLESVIALADLEAFRTRPRTAALADQEKTVEAPPPPPAAPGGTLPEETVRVSVAKLDILLAHISELLMARMRAMERLEQIRRIEALSSTWQKDWQTPRGTSFLAGQEAARGDKAWNQMLVCAAKSQERVRRMADMTAELARQWSDDTLQLSLVVGELEEEVKRVRMLPLHTITAPFGRMVRDLAQAAGKEAILEIEGGDTELDKQVLEQIKDPLVHLLRNAIDHGIETPQEREASQKPRVGRVKLSAGQQGQTVVVRLADDGAGLDYQALRNALARQGRRDAPDLEEDALQDLAFSAGVSTSPIITDISGRGIGLAVVRRNVETLHGRVEVSTEEGKGTQFTLILPLTLTSARGLLVRAAGQVLAIPVSEVERIVALRPGDVFALEGQPAIRVDGRPVTLARLDEILGLPPQSEAGQWDNTPAVVVSAAERWLALAVDELPGEQAMVIKGMGRQLRRVAGIAGATVLGNGDVVLILSVPDLLKMASRAHRQPVLDPPSTEEATRPRRILVVDDSLTTRTLEKNILEAAGYYVTLATDGQEALAAMAGEVPDLVISDILMPRVDGFQLTRRLKSDERTAHVPIILVSSLDSPADKARGIEAGADAYIVKGRFDQGNLLETIEQLT